MDSVPRDVTLPSLDRQRGAARPGMSMFWGPNVWAGLRAGDAGEVQQRTSSVYPTGRVALALRAGHTAQLDCVVLCCVVFCGVVLYCVALCWIAWFALSFVLCCYLALHRFYFSWLID